MHKEINLLKKILNSDITYSHKLIENDHFIIKKYGIELIYYNDEDLYFIGCNSDIMYNEILNILYNNNNILEEHYGFSNPWIYIRIYA